MKPILSKLLDLKDKGNESSEPVGKNTNLVLRVKKKKKKAGIRHGEEHVSKSSAVSR